MSKPSVKPYNSLQSKKDQVKHMFNMIASKYDILNHTLSLGMDYIWRKKAIKKILNNPKKILDIATGTADFAISAAKHTQANITGIDIWPLQSIFSCLGFLPFAFLTLFD